MKKLFSIFAASMMLFAASCSSEKIDEPTGDGNVTFAVQLPEGLQSRAIADGTTANTLYVSVYEKDGTQPLSVSPAAQAISLTKTVTLQLVTGKTYDIVFWAQAADAPYSYQADGRKVQMNYNVDTKHPANDENRDAFFYILNDFTVTGPMSQAVTLKRPFAQLNFATSDMAAAQASGLDVATTSVVVKQLLPTLNLDNGLAEGTPADVTFTDAAIPNVQKTVGTQTYEYLSFNYLLMDETRSTVDVKLTAKESNSDLRELEVASVPVQRNYRTNIYGALLTSSVNYNVTIDPNFGGENNTNPLSPMVNGVECASFAEAVNVINASSETEFTLKLRNTESWATGNAGNGANVAFTNPAATVTIDLNGQRLVMTGQGGFRSDAKVKFSNGTIVDQTSYTYESGETAWEFTYLEFQGAEMTFDNVVFNNTVMFDNSLSTVNNCTFKAISTLASNQASEYAAWVTKSVTFTGCTFENLYRGIKIANKYAQASEAAAYVVTVDGCTFKNLSKKPGLAIDNAAYSGIAPFSSITIKNSTFTDVQPGDQYKYIYETDNTVPTLDNNDILFASVAGLQSLQTSVVRLGNAQSYSGVTFKLGADIDLAGIAWTPIGQTGAGQFGGTFDGNGFKISNLNVNNDSADDNCATGLFGWLNGATVKNVKIEGAVVKGHHNVGVIAGYLEASGCNITGCTVNNAQIECTSVNSEANGDKCGGIVGHAGNDGVSVASCVVTNSTISAGRDAGQVVGAALVANVTNCSATNVTVTANGTSTGANIRNEVIGRIL